MRQRGGSNNARGIRWVRMLGVGASMTRRIGGAHAADAHPVGMRMWAWRVRSITCPFVRGLLVVQIVMRVAMRASTSEGLHTMHPLIVNAGLAQPSPEDAAIP